MLNVTYCFMTVLAYGFTCHDVITATGVGVMIVRAVVRDLTPAVVVTITAVASVATTG